MSKNLRLPRPSGYATRMTQPLTHEQLVDHKGADMADLIRQLRAAPHILRDSVRDLSPQDLEATPIPGKWSTRQCVEHIALVSLGWTNIFYEAIAAAHPNLRHQDPQWAAPEEARARLSVTDALDVYERNNLRLADFLATLPPQDWTRKFPPVQWLTSPFEIRDHLHWGTIGHLHHHLKFIEEKRAAMLTKD